jgi:hypothetical protein
MRSFRRRNVLQSRRRVVAAYVLSIALHAIVGACFIVRALLAPTGGSSALPAEDSIAVSQEAPSRRSEIERAVAPTAVPTAVPVAPPTVAPSVAQSDVPRATVAPVPPSLRAAVLPKAIARPMARPRPSAAARRRELSNVTPDGTPEAPLLAQGTPITVAVPTPPPSSPPTVMPPSTPAPATPPPTVAPSTPQPTTPPTPQQTAVATVAPTAPPATLPPTAVPTRAPTAGPVATHSPIPQATAQSSAQPTARAVAQVLGTAAPASSANPAAHATGASPTAGPARASSAPGATAQASPIAGPPASSGAPKAAPSDAVVASAPRSGPTPGPRPQSGDLAKLNGRLNGMLPNDRVAFANKQYVNELGAAVDQAKAENYKAAAPPPSVLAKAIAILRQGGSLLGQPTILYLLKRQRILGIEICTGWKIEQTPHGPEGGYTFGACGGEEFQPSGLPTLPPHPQG